MIAIIPMNPFLPLGVAFPLAASLPSSPVHPCPLRIAVADVGDGVRVETFDGTLAVSRLTETDGSTGFRVREARGRRLAGAAATGAR